MTKPIGEDNYAYRQWKKTDMEKAVSEAPTSTLSKTGLAKKHHVPITTMKDRIGRGDKVAVVGHPKYFKKKERNYIANYTHDSKEIGLPRRKRHLKADIEHVIIKKRRTNCPFKDNKPGKNWFKNMKEEFKDEFPVYEDDANDPVFTDNSTLNDWCKKKRKHIVKFNGSQLLDSRERVFVVELDTCRFDAADKTKSVRIVICYSADGYVLNPLFLNSGYFHQNTMRRHIGRITFLWSPNKEVDKDILLFIVMDIRNHMKEEGIMGPVVLWVTPPLYDSYSLISWMDARKGGVIIEFFPEHLYQSYRLTNRGVFDKLLPALDKEIQRRLSLDDFTSSFHSFCDLFWDIWATIGMSSHLKKSCQGYKLCHLRRSPRGTNTEELNDQARAKADGIKARYRKVTHPFALPPFTHMRLQSVQPQTTQKNAQITRTTGISHNLDQILNVQNKKSDMAPFNTGVHAHRNVPGLKPPVNPDIDPNRTRVACKRSQHSLSQNAGTTSRESTDIVCLGQSQMPHPSQGSGINVESDNSPIFQYSYGSDGLHICEVPNTRRRMPTQLIKVEVHDPRYGQKPKKVRSKGRVTIKSEDSTDSE